MDGGSVAQALLGRMQRRKQREPVSCALFHPVGFTFIEVGGGAKRGSVHCGRLQKAEGGGGAAPPPPTGGPRK